MAKEIQPAPIELTKVATATVAPVEVSDGTPGAFQVAGKSFIVQPCQLGDTIAKIYAEDGQPGKAMHTRWKKTLLVDAKGNPIIGPDGQQAFTMEPDPESEIQIENGKGFIEAAPIEETP